MSEKSSPYPLMLPPDLQKQIKKAAKQTSLSQADLMRQALRFGIPEVVSRIVVEVPLVNVKPFAEGTLAEIYRKKDKWETTETAATSAQPAPDFDA